VAAGTTARANYALAMAAEIERKFLLDGPPDRLQGRTGREIEQGYLAGAGGVEVRLRREEDRRLLTIKRGRGEVREEIEFPLNPRVFEALWSLTESRRLGKTRYLVPLGEGLEAEVDVYEGDLAGLVTAEVEFGFERQSREFQPPSWLGREVTGDRRYSNQSLALAGAPLLRPAENGEQERMPSSRAYRLKAKESPSDGLRRIALGRAGKALERLDSVYGDELAAAIHGARKDLKKLRALLRLVRPELGEKTFKAENRRYRDAGRLLAGSRDAEVKLETLVALRQRFGDLPAGTAELWAGRLEAERDELAAATRDDAQARIAPATEAIAAGRDELRRWSLGADSWALVEAGLFRSYGEGWRALRRTRSKPTAENVHRWRKRAKDLWYQLRIIEDAWPELLGATVGQVHDLTELLGDHHDLAVLAEDLAGRRDLGDGAPFEAAIAERQEQLFDAAIELGVRLYAEKPKAFRRRTERYWRAWRQT
jgi:CYTH domain-containing protein/CHAD domain-containing protein